jgi:hypothetical protein
VDIEWIIFRVRLRPWRDKPAHAGTQRCNDQVSGSLTAHTGISLGSLGHLARIEPWWEIGQLMNDDVRVSGRNRP